MNQASSKISCPKCGQMIDVNEIVYHQLDTELKEKYRDALSKEQQKFKQQQAALEKEKQAIQQKIDAGIKLEKSRLLEEVKKKLEEEQAERIALMQSELKEKTAQVKELNKSKVEIEKLKREKDEMRATLEVEAEKKLSTRLVEEREKIKKSEESRAQLKLSEREQVIKQLQEQLKEAQRKAEQGSMQLQGEVQELAIEDWLASQFPLDTIEEIKKGAQGADCLQIVNTRSRQNCGSIYYESKRAKNFSLAWIEKFKNDIREKNANIGVLVTQSMPVDMERMGLKDGVWICTFDEFKGLCLVLRESIVQISNAITIQENKGDKMGMLYDFLTSNEFRLQIEAIVEGFTQMQSDLETEKRAMNKLWKQREKQIEKVLLNTGHMYGSIKGIAGNAVQSVALLEHGFEDE